jgi:hypothetical protein
MDLVWRMEMSKGWVVAVMLGVAMVFCAAGCDQGAADAPTTSEEAKASRAEVEKREEEMGGMTEEEKAAEAAARAEGDRIAEEMRKKHGG